MESRDYGQLGRHLFAGTVALAGVVMLLGVVGYTRHHCPAGWLACGTLFELWQAAQILGFALLGWVAPAVVGARIAWRVWMTHYRVQAMAGAGEPLPPRLAALAARLGLHGRVLLSGAPGYHIFTYGLWRPRVVLTRQAVQLLDEDELEAVLRHERQHLRGRDPLRFAVAEAVARTMVPVPLLRDAARALLASAELRADAAAIAEMGDHLPVASAVLKLLRRTPHDNVVLAPAAVGLPETGDLRLQQLLLGHRVRVPAIGRRSWVISGVVLAVLIGLTFLCS